MLKLLRFLALLLLVLLIVVLARTLVVPSRQIGDLPHTPETIDSQKLAKDLAGAIPGHRVS